MDLGVNGTAQLKVTGRTKSGIVANFAQRGTTVSYSSDNTSIATVDSNGVVTAKAKGVAKVTATVVDKGVTMTQDMYVVVGDAVKEIGISTTKGTSMAVNDVFYPNVLSKTEMGLENLLTEGVTLTSSDPAVVEVKNGTLVGKSVGTASITATVNINGKDYSTTKEIKVADRILKTITVTPGNNPIKRGETTTLQVSGKMSDGTVMDLSTIALTYKVDNTSVITLSENNTKITAVANGIARISVQGTLDGANANGYVDVKVYAAGDLPSGWNVSDAGGFGSEAYYGDSRYALLTKGNDYYSAEKGIYLSKTFNLPAAGEVLVATATIESIDNVSTGGSVGILQLILRR